MLHSQKCQEDPKKYISIKQLLDSQKYDEQMSFKQYLERCLFVCFCCCFLFVCLFVYIGAIYRDPVLTKA